MPTEQENFMAQALALAAEAAAAGEVPVGCVIVRDGEIVGRGRNRREEKQATASHAEMEAIAQANEHLGTWRLDDCELYVTLEPCPMCAGAILNARIRRVWYGARDEAFGACGGVTNLFMESFPNRPALVGGILGEDCSSAFRVSSSGSGRAAFLAKTGFMAVSLLSIFLRGVWTNMPAFIQGGRKNMPTEQENFMAQALALAAEAAAAGEVPVGCVIVRDGEIVGRGRNRREEKQATASHAEMEAIAQANEHLGTWRLDDCELYVTLEPCPMCAGAILNARIRRVWYGARDEAFGACGGVTNLFMESFPNRPALVGGILGEDCRRVLADFFAGLRGGEKNRPSDLI